MESTHTPPAAADAPSVGEPSQVHQLEALPFLFSTDGACSLFGCSRRAWFRYVRKYSIPRFPAPRRGSWYNRDEVIEAVRRHRDLVG